jgi:hypothetical protein
MLRELDYPIDVNLAWFGGEVNAAILSRGVVGFGSFPMKRDRLDELVPALFKPVSFTGFGVSAKMTVPGYSASYDRVHFHAVISSLSSISYDGRSTSGLVSERFSEDGAGFYLETDAVYAYPSAGANISMGSPQIGASVRFVELNLECSMSPLYIYWRPRYYLGDVFVSDGDFQGMPITHYETPSLNTGNGSDSWPQSMAICDGISWSSPSWPEVFIGYSPIPGYYEAGGSHVEHADAQIDPSGFRFMDGDRMSIPPIGGIPAVYSGRDVLFFTDSIRTSVPLYVCSRMKWTGGVSAWKTRILTPVVSYDDPGRTYTCTSVMEIPAGSSTAYHLQVVYGTSPSLSDYFDDPSDLLPNPSSPYLVYTAYSYDPLQSGEFLYCDGGNMVSPPIGGMSASSYFVVTHSCPSGYSGVGVVYRFWRVLTGGPWIP